jgi:EAL domain-containing protein (putative c-di-GMP-specific phosphodiesterase class I)
MHDAEKVLATLAELDEMGIKLSLDDFGTGYSSLSYLKRFPVERLKIDQSFVNDLGGDTDATAIVRSIIALGHALKLEVLAEGVETPEQLGLLKEFGCDQAQGFVFCNPLPEEAVREFIVKWRA